MTKCAKKIGVTFGAVLVLSAILGGPVATWLQAREYWASPREPWDAVYLVAGARAQDRRIAALIGWLSSTACAEGSDLPQPFRAAAAGIPIILIGNDPQPSYWSREHRRNLTAVEWAREKIETALAEEAIPASTRIVPGVFYRTDTEMEALADYLDGNPQIGRIALVTSHFHARRVLQRLRAYAPGLAETAIVPGLPYWENRAPWIVLAELLKMARDAMGLSRAPLLSRQQVDSD